MRPDTLGICTLGLAVVLGLAGCVSSGSATTGGPIAIADVASIAGKWVGLLEMSGSRDREDYVEVTIDGRLLIRGERGGRGTGTLFTQTGQPPRLLQVNGTAADGRQYILRLRPQS